MAVKVDTSTPARESAAKKAKEVSTALERSATAEPVHEDLKDTPTPPPPTTDGPSISESKDSGKKKKELTPEAEAARKAAHARFMRFRRSLESKQCPPQVRRAGRQAKYSSAKLAVLQEQYEACAGNWKSSDFYMSILNSSRERKQGSRRWLTRQQVIEKYQSEEIGNAICDAKLRDPETAREQTKCHPDLPDREDSGVIKFLSIEISAKWFCEFDLRLFLVWDADSVETTEDTVVSELFKAAEGPDCSDEENNTKRKTNSKNDKKKRKKSRKQSTSSDSSTSDDSKSDDSTSDTESSSSSSSTKVCWGVHACCFL
ncbi:Uncharacterized protein SCF082_LOCUS49684 [Durusdinium trenchii]|uniref:Uncharacterized protein n=1 Tax=Durusdinium trenchii TaxID=1381693 RepID=A0ABP0S2T8_9DINO